MATSGRIIRLPSCWAALMSLTLDDTMTLNSTLNMHANGTAKKRISAVFRSGNREMTKPIVVLEHQTTP